MVAPARDMPEDFGKYRFIRQLGSGGLSTVYLIDNGAKRAVMKIGSADLDEAARERFGAEATALRNLNSPNIPVLLDFGSLPDGRPFLVTEWVEGSDLAALLASGRPFSVREVLQLTQAVSFALACAHKQGMVHRDVKPANILVPDREGRLRFEDAKLLDFGVLGRLEVNTLTTRSGMVVGTPYYMSPEQIRGGGLTPAADIFSLGVVAYETLSGKRPFEGDNLSEVFLALISKEAPRLGPPIPYQVADLVQRCLEKQPGRRPPSGVEMSGLINALLWNFDGLLDAPALRAELSRVAASPAPAAFSPSYVSPTVTATHKHMGGATSSSRIIAAAFAGFAMSVVAVLLVAVRFLAGRRGSAPPSVPTVPAVAAGGSEPWIIVGGVLLAVSGVAIGMVLRRYFARKREQITGEISELLKGGRTKKALSMTLAIQVDEVIAKCRLMDEKFLGLTMALMVKEYDSARKFDDRQKALMNAIAILDKLGPKLSPWYIRHDKLVATGVSLVGIISGLATVAQSVAKLVRGGP